ncbi:MAG: S9 family peptidase [Bacteroidetes bacterium]|nr:S9 family peptidase [Bacteroidota bacterium]
MKKMLIILLGVNTMVISLGMIIISCDQSGKSMKPPRAKKIRKELTLHGDTRIDYYYWLNEMENPDVFEYLKAENAYTKAIMKHTEKLQEEIYNEIIGRIKQTDMSVPYKLNGYYYYTRYEEGKEYPLYCRKKGSLESEEKIMIDGNKMAEGYEFISISGLNVSPDNKLLAFGVDTVSRRQYTIYVKDLETGDLLTEAIPKTTGYAAWANDNRTLFYTCKNDETLRPEKIFRHELGNNITDDKLVFFEEDEKYATYAYNSKSREYIMIGSNSTLSTEYQFLDARQPGGEFKVIQPRQRELEYSVEHYKDKFYIRTNYEAKNFRLMETPVDRTTIENWREVIPHREGVLLENFEIFKNYLALNERKKGLTHIRILDWQNNDDYYIDFGESTYLAYISINPEFNTDLIRYGFTSLTTPNSIYDYNMKSRERELLKRQEVLGGYNPDDYQSERHYATADDGTLIPVSLVYKKGIQLNGDSPVLLYGYGSYGSSNDPYFSFPRLSLLNRGFIYVLAHVRGGEEMGRSWYEDGKLLNKKNTFTDFIDCAEYLIEKKYTTPDKLFALGGSAGGLLMGAVVNMRPDLFRGVISAVPFVDVVTTMLDEDIPLTTSEYNEWGNPAKKEYYDYILSYSPYDNVTEQDYPALLVTTGLHDSQVQYWEPVKWVAKLRDKKTNNELLLLWTNMDYGHSGASGRFKQYKETALEYAFLLKILGIDK